MCEARQGEGIAQGGTALKRDGKGQQYKAVPGKGEGIARQGWAARGKAKLWRGDEMRLDAPAKLCLLKQRPATAM